mmetsp:Transcript_18837/g.40611  ORF Transcript_18837/g.40611 Transcript_18837/m.40611 type:complete len:293 (-) Transcript_18837:545-1423(-)
MQARDLLVELLRQQVDLVLVLGLGLVVPGGNIRLAQLELGQRLVGERVGHDEGRVARGTAEVQQAALRKHNHAMAVGKDVLVALRLDVHAGSRLLESLHLDLVVEVANVADDGVVLHLLHVLQGDDVLVTGGGDKDIGDGNDVLHGDDLEAFHAGLQRADRVNLGDVHDGGLRFHRLGGALSDVAEAADDDLLAREHDVGRAHDAVRQRVAAAVDVVKLRLGDAIVHVDGGEEELALLSHRDKTVDAGGCLLGDADHACDHLGEALGVLLDGGLDGGEHTLELSVVRGGRVG